MQQIIISGALITDVQKLRDRNGRDYLRFTVTCGSTDINGRSIFTHYRCISYITGYGKLKKGDQVFITGKFTPSLMCDENGKTYMNLDVMVASITPGYRAEDKKR